MRWIAFGIQKALFIETRDKRTLEFPICSINTQPIHGDTAQDRDTYLLEDLRPERRVVKGMDVVKVRSKQSFRNILFFISFFLFKKFHCLFGITDQAKESLTAGI